MRHFSEHKRRLDRESLEEKGNFIRVYIESASISGP